MKLKGKMLLDLTPVGGRPESCEVQIAIDDGGVAEDFQAVLPGLPAEQIDRLLSNESLPSNQPMSGELEDGRRFQACISMITSCYTNPDGALIVAGSFREVDFDNAAHVEVTPHEWVFKLSNFRLRFGDVATEKPRPPGLPVGIKPGWTLDSIEFEVGGRGWRLTDDLFNTWKNIAKTSLARPVISGTLRTAFRQGDTPKELEELAQDIADLLGFALSRSVNWVSHAIKDGEGNTIRGYSRSAWTTGFNKNGFVPLDNFQRFTLKRFLEGAHPVLLENREWYSKTLRMLVQGQIADILEVRMSLLYMLADRISSFVLGKFESAEIDPELKSRARKQEFVAELHGVLSKLSPNWTQEHTDSVLTEIKRWNKMPSFVKKIQRTCQALGLPAPDPELLRPRNELLHDGELDPGDTGTHEHYLALDWVVLTMALRLFGYDGVYYHRTKGNEPVKLSDHLVHGGGLSKP